ncbi:MAG TPA: hypothetical protein VF638_05480 [Sphingomonas sp.]
MDTITEKDIVAAGTVAIAGVMGICTELAANGLLRAEQIKAIGDFMLDASERSGASPLLQAHMHQALSHHFSNLLRALQDRDLQEEGRSPPKPEAP